MVVAGALIFSFVNWRCPACTRYLGRGWNPKFCPKCGVQLRD
jgi:rubrerythrin